MTNQQQRQHHQQQQQQYFEDDHTIETIANNTAADNVDVEVEDLVFIHSVFIKIKNNRKHQERSNVSRTANTKQSFETLLSEQYELKEESFFKSWFERKVIHNPRNERITITVTNNNQLTNTNTKLSIPKLCGISSNLQIYFRNNEYEQSKSKSKRKLKPINKLATLLTFNPDTGLYGQLIRGNAYIVVINNNNNNNNNNNCLLYTSPSPRDLARSRMPSSA